MRSSSKKRPKVNPRNIPKASQFRSKQGLSNTAIGKRDRTKNGYRIEGTKSKSFETFIEYIGERQSTDKVVHKKKTRTYRIVAGQGFAILEKDGVQKSVVLVPGHELTVEPGIAYQLATTSSSELEMFVVQSSNYEAQLEVLEESSTEALLDEKRLESLTHTEAVRNTTNRRSVSHRNSKAAMQQAALASGRPSGGSVSRASANVSPAEAARDPNYAVNLRPTMGRDLRGAEG